MKTKEFLAKLYFAVTKYPFWLLHWYRHRGPNNTLKMHLFKQSINFTVKIINRVVPYKTGVSLNSVVLEKTRNHLMDLEHAEHKLIQARGESPDNNFLNLLKASFKTLVYLAETDPYYNLWLGEFMRSVTQERGKIQKDYVKRVKNNLQIAVKTGLVQKQDIKYVDVNGLFDLKTCGGLVLLDEKLRNDKLERDKQIKAASKIKKHPKQKPKRKRKG